VYKNEVLKTCETGISLTGVETTTTSMLIKAGRPLPGKHILLVYLQSEQD